MIALILFNLVPLGVALLIGLFTARWMFADRRRAPAKPPRNSTS